MAIISCEAFWRYENHIPEIAARLSPFDVTVIAVLRRQDRLLASNFTHLVRQEDYSGTPDSLWAKTQHLLDFHNRLRLWAAWMPTRAILYPENRQGLIEGFLDAIDAGRSAIRVASRLRDHYSDRNAAPTATDPERILGPALAETVRNELRDSNKALFAEFFSQQDYDDSLWT
jgi:hypothetical protein